MQYGLGNWVAANDGIYYMADSTGTSIHGNFKPPGNESLYDMPVTVISAYDIINDTVLWQYQVPVGNKHETMINKDNARDLLGLGMESYDMSWLNDDKKVITQVDTWTKIRIYPAHGNIYVSYMAANIEEPYVLNQSRCVYSSGIYALDSKGTAMLEKPTGAYNSMFASNNSTIFYLADGGKITVMTIGVAVTGLAALVAAALLFFKFIGIGSVTRARSRIDKNENRNSLLQFIIENPGVTIYDISKALGMNRGTVRYHLLILELNHRIAVLKDDSKFIRYFPNSNRYSKEEQLLISMIRRDTIKRVIQLLFMKPGLTNVEISSVTGLADSGISRYLKELSDKGIVLKSEVTPGRYAYSLTDATSKTVEKLYWVVNSEGKAQASTPGNAEA
jgi:predicted transcriptional regulator